MVADMSYTTLSGVVESWEDLRRIPDYGEKVGVKLFEKLFELEPDAKQLFGFKKEAKVENLLENPKFSRHAKNFVYMFDKAIEMMGPDIELLTDILLELGAKHVAYGVKAEYYPSMGRALISTIKEMLGDDFTEMIENSWYEMFGAISYDMIRAQQRVRDVDVKLKRKYSDVSATSA